MLRLKKKREARSAAHAARQLYAVDASIVALPDDDLLDLADIFSERRETKIVQSAFGEVARRGLEL